RARTHDRPRLARGRRHRPGLRAALREVSGRGRLNSRRSAPFDGGRIRPRRRRALLASPGSAVARGGRLTTHNARASRRRSVMSRTRAGQRLDEHLLMPASSERQVVIAPRSLVTLAALAFVGVLVFVLARALSGILTQWVVPIVLAMALEPLVQLCERRGLRRGQAVA